MIIQDCLQRLSGGLNEVVDNMYKTAYSVKQNTREWDYKKEHSTLPMYYFKPFIGNDT